MTSRKPSSLISTNRVPLSLPSCRTIVTPGGRLKVAGCHCLRAGTHLRTAWVSGLPTMISQMPSLSVSRRRTPLSRVVSTVFSAWLSPRSIALSSAHFSPSKCQMPLSLPLLMKSDALPLDCRTPKRAPASVRVPLSAICTRNTGKAEVFQRLACGSQTRVCRSCSLPITASMKPSLLRSSNRTPLSCPLAARSACPPRKLFVSRSRASRKLRNLILLPCLAVM